MKKESEELRKRIEGYSKSIDNQLGFPRKKRRKKSILDDLTQTDFQRWSKDKE